jgi:hypothetical protein
VLVALLPLLLTGCTPDPTGGPTDGTTPVPTGSTHTGTPTTGAEGDLARVLALLDGEAELDDVLGEVAWSGGWPVRDGDSAWFVFAARGGGAWSVAGDFDGWSGTPMTAGDGFWWAEVELGADPAGQTYKFTDGAEWLADPVARSYRYDAYGEISFVAPPTDAPRLDRWPGLGGDTIAPRELRVWVPPGAGPWPTLYAHDGQNLFDPGAIWGGWRLPDALATREPMLVVGIDNTADRFEDYTHVPDDIGYGAPLGGNGDAYAAFVDEVVRPHVEDVYGAPTVAGVMGSSLGGLISLVIAQDRPGRYQFAASLSGTLGWGRFGLDEPTIEERWLAAPPPDLVVYVDSGGGPGPDGTCRDLDGDGFSEDDPDGADNYCETRQFADALAASGYTWDQDLFHWWEPDAPHDEMAWAARVGPILDRFLSVQ